MIETPSPFREGSFEYGRPTEQVYRSSPAVSWIGVPHAAV